MTEKNIVTSDHKYEFFSVKDMIDQEFKNFIFSVIRKGELNQKEHMVEFADRMKEIGIQSINFDPYDMALK